MNLQPSGYEPDELPIAPPRDHSLIYRGMSPKSSPKSPSFEFNAILSLKPSLRTVPPDSVPDPLFQRNLLPVPEIPLSFGRIACPVVLDHVARFLKIDQNRPFTEKTEKLRKRRNGSAAFLLHVQTLSSCYKVRKKNRAYKNGKKIPEISTTLSRFL